MCISCGAAEYTFPESRPVTDACKDLLRRILVVDPAKRITISAIQVPAGFRFPIRMRCACLHLGPPTALAPGIAACAALPLHCQQGLSAWLQRSSELVLPAHAWAWSTLLAWAVPNLDVHDKQHSDQLRHIKFLSAAKRPVRGPSACERASPRHHTTRARLP